MIITIILEDTLEVIMNSFTKTKGRVIQEEVNIFRIIVFFSKLIFIKQINFC